MTKLPDPGDKPEVDEQERRERQLLITVTRGELTWEDLSLWLESEENEGGAVELVDGEDGDNDERETFLVEFEDKQREFIISMYRMLILLFHVLLYF